MSVSLALKLKTATPYVFSNPIKEHKDTENCSPFIGDLLDQFGIGRAAFYRYLPTGQIFQGAEA